MGNGISIPFWGVLIVLGVVLLIIGFFTIRAAIRCRIKWVLVPGEQKIYYFSEKSVDPALVKKALDTTRETFAKYGPWQNRSYLEVMQDSFILVHSTENWTDLWGRKVAGLSWCNGLIEVGSALSGLAHEYAHLLQWRLDKTEDPVHLNWKMLGIFEAIDYFWMQMKPLTTNLIGITILSSSHAHKCWRCDIR